MRALQGWFSCRLSIRCDVLQGLNISSSVQAVRLIIQGDLNLIGDRFVPRKKGGVKCSDYAFTTIVWPRRSPRRCFLSEDQMRTAPTR